MTAPISRYALAGVRIATTAAQEAFIARATDVLRGDDRIIAGWLVGGFAVGDGDAFSDIDLQCFGEDESRSEWLGSDQTARRP